MLPDREPSLPLAVCWKGKTDSAPCIFPNCNPTLSYLALADDASDLGRWAKCYGRYGVRSIKYYQPQALLGKRYTTLGFLGSCARFSRWLRSKSTAPTNHAVGFGPIQPTKRAIQDASLLGQGVTEALQLDENVQLGIDPVVWVCHQMFRSQWMAAESRPRMPIRAAS